MKTRRFFFAQQNPVVQFFYFAAVLLTTAFAAHPLVLACSLAGALFFLFCERGKGKLSRGLAFLAMCPVVVLFHAMFQHYGVTVLFYVRTGAVTLEAVVYGAVLAMILWISILWLTAMQEIFTTDRFVYLFGRVQPTLSLLLSMIFSFLPRLTRQAKLIREGQKSFYREGRFRRIRAVFAEWSILVTWALEHSIETADSMQARGYGTAKRTSYAIYPFQKRDAGAAAFLLLLYGISLYGFLNGCASAQYNPVIWMGGISLTAKNVVTYAAWLLFCLYPALLQAVGFLGGKNGHSSDKKFAFHLSAAGNRSTVRR